MVAPYLQYLDGEFTTDGASGEIEVINPATEDVVRAVPRGTVDAALRAADAAARAYPAWRARTAYERAPLLRRTAELIRERAADMARTMTQEVGKPVAESRGEILAAADQFEWYSEEAKRVYGRTVPSHWPDKRITVIRQPVGVTYAVGPWNFPVLLLARKLAPALAVGCTVVGRPASQAPLAAMEMVGCMHDAGLPAGVVNLVTGPAREVSHAMLAHPEVRKVSFTGSTEVGRELMAAAAAHVTNVSLELGGHAPVLVFPDVDPEDAAAKCVQAKFRNMGQVCISPTRFYVHAEILERFSEAVVDRISQLRLGNGLEEGTDVGPLFDAGAVERMEEFIANATAAGARVLIGGRRPGEEGFERGFWFLPTAIADVPDTSRLMCEEVFGPLLPIIPFTNLEDAIRQANDTVYGLAAYVLAHDITTATRAVEGLDYGIIGLNDLVPATAEAPFGGMKQSGLGREGGTEGIDAYLETKYVCTGL